MPDLLARADAGLLLAHDDGPHRIGSIVIYDATDRQRLVPHAVVLAVGLRAGSAELADLVASAACAGAVAVVAKATSQIEHEALRALGALHGISTVAADAGADWLLVATSLRSASSLVVDAVTGVRVGDLFGFANAVARATGGATAIVDAAGRLLGFSSIPGQPLDELRRRTTLLMAEQDSPVDDPDYQRLYGTAGPVRFPGSGEVCDRVAVAVRSDQEILGSIWVLVPGQQWRAVEGSLQQFLEPAVMHLHHARADLGVQRTRQAALLGSLLRGDAVEGAVADLALEHRRWFRLATLAPSTARESVAHPQVRAVTTWLRIVHRDALLTELDSRPVILFSGSRATEWTGVDQSLQHFFSTSDTVRGRASVVVSRSVDSISRLPGELGRLRILAASPFIRSSTSSLPPVLRMDERWATVEIVAMAQRYADHDAGRAGVLSLIRQYDHRHGSEQWDTLVAFVRCDRNVVATADFLHVHPNTVRYRIERVRARFGVDAYDLEQFVWLCVALHGVAGGPHRGDIENRA